MDDSPPDAATHAPKRIEYRYDVKLEVGVNPDGEPIQIVAIFRELVKKMKAAVDPDKPLAVLTATDKLYIEQKEMTSEEFQREFKVDHVDGRTSKVMLGFKLHTMTTLYEIKQRLMKTYLLPRNLFMREHAGGFLHGVKFSAYGFLKDDHPDHPDIHGLKTRFNRWLGEAWKKLDKADKAKWKEDLPCAFYGNTGVNIPITFSKERLTAAVEAENKPKITTSALTVSTPVKYGKLLRALLDIAVLSKKINNLIPFALQKEDPTGYYHLVAHQDRFMDNHRNIPILKVPYDAETKPGIQGKTLLSLLLTNNDIKRVSHDTEKAIYHVSTHAPRYRDVHNWIQTALADHQFPYEPNLRPLKYAGTPGSTTKYSAIFADTISVASLSYDNTTIKTTRSAWKQRPPLNISYEPNAEAFPPLPAKTVSARATQSTTSETLDEDTIQSAISSALKKLEEQHRQELAALKQEMQNKMTEMEQQMKALGQQIVDQTFQALLTDESPLVTKSDHAQMKQEMSIISSQLATLIAIMSKANPSNTSVAGEVQVSMSPLANAREQNRVTPQRNQANPPPYSHKTPAFPAPPPTSKKSRRGAKNKMSNMRIPLERQSFPRPVNGNEDGKWQGDKIPIQKDTDCTRIMFHNVNGLPLRGTDGLDMFVHTQETLQVDIQGFSEHCLDSTKFLVSQQARDIIQKSYVGQYALQLNSSEDSALHQYKPGGTGILILGDTSSRLEPNGRQGDGMGRWSITHFRRRNLPPLSVISIYQVCQRPTNTIGNTAFHQQQRALNMAGRPLHPRKAFMEDLHKILERLIAQGNDIILGGDFNEAMEDKNSGVLQLTTTHHLVDPFLSRFPHHPTFGTHHQGKRRIDIVLVTPRIAPAIQAIGYGPFDHSKVSDHRPLLIDFDTKKLFGIIAPDLPQPVNRGVRTKDIKTVQRFIELTYDAIHQRQGFHYKTQLDDNSAGNQIAELVDEIIGTSEDFAERKCRRRRPEFYSQKIVQQRTAVSMLKCHLNALKRGQDRTAQLYCKMQRTGIITELPATKRLTQEALQKARQQLQETSQSSFQARQDELADNIQKASSTGEKVAKKRLSSLKKAEQASKTYKILKSMRTSQGSNQKIDRVEIPSSWPSPEQEVRSLHTLEDPKTCIDWKEISEPSEVEYYIMLRNRLHFGQAEGTPFTTEPLNDSIDWAATSEDSELLLQGSYTHEIPTRRCQDLLQACKARTELDSVSQELTMDDFRGKLKSWRETTTTSPSGRHLGRYKALFTSLPIEEESDQPSITIAQKQEEIAKLKLALINYCIRNSYVLNRWKRVVNVMIFKEHGNFKIHRLRVIHIYEADFNLILAVKWRQLLWQAERKNLLHAGQYGGRPGCEAQSLTLLEELKYDIAYLTRRSLFNFDNDATSCYDRIVVPLASIINRKYGLHRSIVSLHGRTMQTAQFRLKTAIGISDLKYSHCPQFPIHGTGQGSGNSPCIWLFISSTLFDIHQEKANGAQFVSPDGLETVSMSMVGFVDDSTGSCNDFRPQTQQPLPALFAMMENDAQMWSDLLYCTGGKLELTKCSYHVLHFQFKPNGRPIPTLKFPAHHIQIQDAESHTPIPILAKSPFESHKTLGHYKSPYTPTTYDLQHIRDKANRLALLIATSPITRQGAMLAYQTVFLPSIKYTLPQSFYTRQALEQAQSESIRKIIAKCGYNRNTAKELIYAPKSFAGGGFLPWYLLQGEGQISQFLKHWRTNTIVSKTLRIALTWAQWQSGHDRAILEDTHTSLPFLECRWLTSLRKFLSTINATIQVDLPIAALPERQNDIYIMTFARESGLFNDHDLRVINYCRLYLHVTTLSELLDADGLSIMPSVFHCRREPWFNPSTYIVLQQRPTDHHVRITWQKLCRQWVNSAGNLAASIEIGTWIRSGEHLRRWRQTYKTPNPRGKIYHWRFGKYWEYRRTDVPTVFRPHRPTEWQPTHPCMPINAHEFAEGCIQIQNLPRVRLSTRTQHIAQDFDNYISHLGPWERSLLTDISFKYSPYEIMHRLLTHDSNSELLLVSDGSQSNKDLTYGWVFGTTTGVIYAEHSGVGTGPLTSHRAEAWGMLSATLFLRHLEAYTDMASQVTPRPLIAMSDNAGLVKRLHNRQEYAAPFPNATLSPDWDIVEQIYMEIQQLQVLQPSHEWVKGHQDAVSTDLTTAATFNVRADELASLFREKPDPHIQSLLVPLTTNLLPSERCRFRIGETAVQGHYGREIRLAFTVPPLKTYLAQRHRWTPQLLDCIDWQVFTKAAQRTQVPSPQLLKLVYDKLPTRYELHKTHGSATNKCHYCNSIETFAHLLRCQNPTSQRFRDDVIEQLEAYFEKTAAPEYFQEVFWSTQRWWLPSGKADDSPVSDDLPGFELQEKIGWQFFLKGYLSTEWRAHYEYDNPYIPACDTESFLIGIVCILWNSELAFWSNHTANTHQVSQQASLQGYTITQEYKDKIRKLHSQRDQCLHGHRDHYFYQDVETFLSTATNTQMKSYLHHYEPAILQSIHDAKQNPIRSIFTFPGFTHFRQSLPQPRCRGTTHLAPQDQQTKRTTLPQSERRGGFFTHKHTRWKSPVTLIKSIREYFQKPQPD